MNELLSSCHDMTEIMLKAAETPFSLLKALWGKEKGENAGNHHFPISYNVFYTIKEKLLSLSHFKIANAFNLDKAKILLYGNCPELTLSPLYTHLNTSKKKALENIEEKGEIAQNEQFHPFPQCFLGNLKIV